jgi:hypothetical protein
MDSLFSFPVGLFHPLQHAGLARRTPDCQRSGWKDVKFYRDWVERLIERTETRRRFKTPEDKAEVVALFRKALDLYRSAERPTGTR